jgi:hypothetical protein
MRFFVASLVACSALFFVTSDARADGSDGASNANGTNGASNTSVLDDARSSFMPEFHSGLEVHSTTLVSGVSLCAPSGRYACPTVRSLGTSGFPRGTVTHGGLDAGFDFLGIGPLRLGVGVYAGFGGGPTGPIGGDAGAPGAGASASNTWRAVGASGIVSLRLAGDHWAGWVELMPGAMELMSDVSGSYPALRVDTTIGMLSGRVGFTIPVTRLIAIGPSVSAATAFGDPAVVDVSGGVRLEVRLNALADDAGRARREQKEREEREEKAREEESRKLDEELARYKNIVREEERSVTPRP